MGRRFPEQAGRLERRLNVPDPVLSGVPLEVTPVQPAYEPLAEGDQPDADLGERGAERLIIRESPPSKWLLDQLVKRMDLVLRDAADALSPDPRRSKDLGLAESRGEENGKVRDDLEILVPNALAAFGAREPEASVDPVEQAEWDSDVVGQLAIRPARAHRRTGESVQVRERERSAGHRRCDSRRGDTQRLQLLDQADALRVSLAKRCV